jgi:pSer/pThr/pTyr-binding forkhead associated (FHA) protein
MSGVEDGLRLNFSPENGDGQVTDSRWSITIGRREDSDIYLRNDIFVSRTHAYIHHEQDLWWLEDNNSTNGTFLEENDNDARVHGRIPIEAGQLFRVGRTWLRIEPIPEL